MAHRVSVLCLALYCQSVTELTSNLGPYYPQMSALGAGEMAQWAKHSLYEHEPPSLDPKNPCNTEHSSVCL